MDIAARNITAKLDEIPRPFWIVFMILGFVFYWPIGLLILAYLIWSRRMGCSTRGRMGRWQNEMRDRFGGQHWQGPSSGNRAFDDYREETLRRLEEEQREFVNFLDRLRHAKDKEEFDQFMAQHRQRPTHRPRTVSPRPDFRPLQPQA